MKAFTLLTLAIAGLGSARALDLTPVPSFRLLEGMKISVVSFDDGRRKVNWQPPADWQLSGGGNQLNLYPAKVPLAAMQLKLIAHAAGQVPDATSMDDLLKWATGFLPGDATSVVFDHEAPNPFLLGGKPSRELKFNYVSVARKFSTSIALVDLDEKQSFALVITASVEDFPAIYSAATQSMFRWNWLQKPITSQDVSVAADRVPAPSAISANKPTPAR